MASNMSGGAGGANRFAQLTGNLLNAGAIRPANTPQAKPAASPFQAAGLKGTNGATISDPLGLGLNAEVKQQPPAGSSTAALVANIAERDISEFDGKPGGLNSNLFATLASAPDFSQLAS